MPTIDWTDLAQRLRSIGAGEHAGSRMARLALEEIIGQEIFRSAVDHYITLAPGYELARHVLWLIHPFSAMARCHEIYTDSPNLDERRAAIELLRVVADGRALRWVSMYLNDPDDQIQCWAAAIVDQLLWSNLVEVEECETLLRMMAEHPHEGVREKHAFVMRYLAEREREGQLRF